MYSRHAIHILSLPRRGWARPPYEQISESWDQYASDIVNDRSLDGTLSLQDLVDHEGRTIDD